VAYPLPIDRRGHESKAILAVHDNSSRFYSSGPGAAAGEENSPGGNIPGLTNIAEQLSGKRLELLKEINPKITKVAVFRNPTIPTLREPNKMSLMWQCDLVDE